MSLAPALAQLRNIEPEALGRLLPEALAVKQGVTLPQKLLSDLRGCNASDIKQRLAKQLPALMDDYRTDKETFSFIKTPGHL